MNASITEFKALTSKAALGAGLPPGLAVEAACASAWLSQRGLDGAGALLDALANAASERQAPVGSDDWAFPCTLAAYDAPSAFDLLVSGDARRVRLEQVDSPLLVLGQAGVAAACYEAQFELQGSDVTVLVTPEGVGADAVGARWDASRSIVARVATGATVVGALLPCAERIQVSDAHLAALDRYARATLVPATVASRALGAGGGDSAND